VGNVRERNFPFWEGRVAGEEFPRGNASASDQSRGKVSISISGGEASPRGGKKE